jgi:DegV family protein with EDD domain
MPTYHIVTDSAAHFANPHYVHQHPITVVPNKITIAGRTYREGVDLTPEDAFRLMAHQPYAPKVQAPSEADFLAVYTRLARTSDGILSIHASREIFPGWQRAQAAAVQMAGHCPIVVIDSGSVSTGQAMLVRVAVQTLEGGGNLDDAERAVRGAIERVFSVYYVETMDYLLQNKILAPSHTILGAMLGIKPCLTIEGGRLKPMEKVRTRIQAIERLVEFVVEFTDIDDAVIVQHKPYMSEQTRMLQDRLAIEFPGRHFPYAVYGPSLAALIGADATGLVVLETETENEDDDF